MSQHIPDYVFPEEIDQQVRDRCKAVQGSHVRERGRGAQAGHQGVWDSCNHTVRQWIVLCRQGRPQEAYRHLDSDHL